MSTRKGRKTPRQAEALRKQRERGKGLRAWLEGRLRARQDSDQTPARETPPGGSGKTRLMRNIQGPRPQYLVRHDFPTPSRHNVPYRKPLETLRANPKGSRRLRRELER